MKVIKMTDHHKEDLINLLVEKYNKIYETIEVLPKKYNEENISDLVNFMVTNNTGYILVDSGIIGFIHMTYIGQLFYDKKGIYTAEWGHNFESLNQKQHMLLLNALYDFMTANELKDHTISVFNDKKDLIVNLFDLSYGSRCLDAHILVEKYSSLHKKIRPAIKEDIDKLKVILDEHHDHLSGPPTLIGRGFDDSKLLLSEWFEDDKIHLFVLEEDKTIMGLLKLVHGESGGCDSSYNDQTLGVETTQLLSKYQGKGYGDIFIDFIKSYAYNNGFSYVAVDFETMNYKANSFWLKHFEPTIRSLIRSLG